MEEMKYQEFEVEDIANQRAYVLNQKQVCKKAINVCGEEINYAKSVCHSMDSVNLKQNLLKIAYREGNYLKIAIQTLKDANCLVKPIQN